MLEVEVHVHVCCWSGSRLWQCLHYNASYECGDYCTHLNRVHLVFAPIHFHKKMVNIIVIIKQYMHLLEFHVNYSFTCMESINVKRYSSQATSSQQEERICLDGQ